MFVDIHSPLTLSPSVLDKYLEIGWFRMGQSVFTTNFLHFNGVLFSAFWLRIPLEDFELTGTQVKINNKNAQFKVKISKFNLTDEKENLFSNYRSNITFDTSESLENLLFKGHGIDIFNTFEISIYNKKKLIGCGVFDKGSIAAEGIISFYDPDYKKYSLGKFLIIQKILYLKQKGFTYFYPGYFAPGYPHFDYKLGFSDVSQYYNIKTNEWLNYKVFDENFSPINLIEQKLFLLSEQLKQSNISHRKVIYDYFDINMVNNYNGNGYLEIPVFLECFLTDRGQLGIFVFDVLTQNFQLLLCNRTLQVNYPNEQEGHYYSFILKPVKIVIESSDAQQIVNKASEIFEMSLKS
jgi:leucyl-tRNA---protein transferase